MTNPSALLRSVIIFALCIPLALILGYTLAGPFDYTFVGVVFAIAFVLILPWLLRNHRPLLWLGWNSVAIVFFLPGAPQLWIPLAFLSLLLSIVQRTIDRNFHFTTVASVAWPLTILGIVVLATAEATGGIKLRSMGGQFYGGKSYLLILSAIVGFFALTAQPIPRERAKLIIAFFFLGGLTTLIGDMLYFQNPMLRWIYLFFPANFGAMESRSGVSRFLGISMASLVSVNYMLAKYGIRDILSSKYPMRAFLFVFFVGSSALGGFRSFFIMFGLLFAIQFYLEGLQRTKLVFIVPLSLLLGACVMLPFIKHMPYTIQRTLSFLPIDVDQAARTDAESSAEWRFRMWEGLLPQVPRYLLVGKGYIITPEDLDYAFNNLMGLMGAMSEDQDGMALVGNYHNGPLSVTIPLGIWGDIAFVWFLVAGCRVVHRNYKYGDPELVLINRFLFAAFVMKIIWFMTLFGAITSDLPIFVGYLGLSVALNGGVCKPVPAAAAERAKGFASGASLPQLQPAFGDARFRR
jgi:hypothetical protein